jgi:hypothetical protein
MSSSKQSFGSFRTRLRTVSFVLMQVASRDGGIVCRVLGECNLGRGTVLWRGQWPVDSGASAAAVIQRAFATQTRRRKMVSELLSCIAGSLNFFVKPVPFWLLVMGLQVDLITSAPAAASRYEDIFIH